MAFGLGFDKAKVLQAAEKYVLQNKIPAAIEEYQKILKKDPKDLLTLNTIGDLYARIGKNEEALKYFQELAEKSLEAGFVPRTIAVYKRVTKLAPEAVEPLLKLGELYSMQGLLRDARTYYLQAVELHMRRQEKEKAREVFEKVLLLDMENPRLHLQMAALYAETGKKEEAIATYLNTAERFLDRNEPDEAEKALEALRMLDSHNAEGKVLEGRVRVEQGDYARAIETLQAIPSYAGNKGALNWLFHSYMKQGDTRHARDIASQLFDLHEDFAGLGQVCEQLLSQGDNEAALEIYRSVAERLVAQRASKDLTEGLRKILTSQPSHVGALELMWEVQRKAGNRGEAEEAAELLAHTFVTNGELQKARDLYAELVAMAPENAEYAQLLRQVEARVSGHAVAREEGPAPAVPVAVDLAAFEPPPPQATAVLSPRDEEIVRNCLTESELYVTYRQFSQAIEMLKKGLEQVPGNIALQESLLRVYERAGQYQEAAGCAEALTEAYIQLGDGDRATQYGELTLNFQQKALEAAPPVPEAASLPTPPAAPPAEEVLAGGAPPAAPSEQAQVREVDLSLEWAALSGTEAAPSAASVADSIAEEIEFYLQAGLVSDAGAAVRRLENQSPSHPSLAGFQARLAALEGGGAPAAAEVPEAPQEAAVGSAPAEEIGLETAPPEAGGAVPSAEHALPFVPAAEGGGETPFGVSMEPPVERAVPPPELAPELPAATPLESPPPAAGESELVLEDLLGLPEAPATAAFELSLEETGVAKAVPQPAEAPPGDQLAALAGELSEILGEPSPPLLAQPPAAPPEPVAAAVPGPPPAAGAGGGLLADLFAEFKEEMEEPGATPEDIETHYNMGIAFKEMALYDEAIGEFQKVHHLAEKAKDTSHLVQCCSLLATCFLEKGMPLLAVQWYQTALGAPGLDPESSLALLYEMGSAYELAGDREAARKSFLEVYGRNIDYRNVADRIRELDQGR